MCQLGQTHILCQVWDVLLSLQSYCAAFLAMHCYRRISNMYSQLGSVGFLAQCIVRPRYITYACAGEDKRLSVCNNTKFRAQLGQACSLAFSFCFICQTMLINIVLNTNLTESNVQLEAEYNLFFLSSTFNLRG